MAVAVAEVLVRVRKTPESAEIAERLRRVWIGTGLTARDVAAGMGLSSPESFRQYLKGNIANWTTAVPKLARGLRMPPELLAEKLGVPFDPQAAALLARISRMTPERQDKSLEIYDLVVDLPPHLQDWWLDFAKVALAGLRADLH